MSSIFSLHPCFLKYFFLWILLHAASPLQLFAEIALVALPVNFRSAAHNHKGIGVFLFYNFFRSRRYLLFSDAHNDLLFPAAVSALSFTAASDIKNLLEEVVNEKALEMAESDSISRMLKDASSFKLDGIHKNVDIKLHRTSKVSEDMIQQYNDCAGPLLEISKRMQKELLKKLKEVRNGYKMTGLYCGKRLNTHSLYRDDMKYFYNSKLPQEKSKLSVGILIDESGSMSCGNRTTSARAAAIVLEDFCRGLNIPCCIYGHTESWSVDMYNYVSFDNIDAKDKYRLMGISARGGNRDGAALAFVGREMQKRTEENRIIILISDGQPAASNYYGEAAEADLRSIKKALNREGIPLFAAAIGEDKENIHRIYGDGFLDIT